MVERRSVCVVRRRDKPITAVLLVEFASTHYYFMVEALNASYAFANTLKKDDWIAVISYDMKPQILADFTQDKRAVTLYNLHECFVGSLTIICAKNTAVFEAARDESLEGVHERKT